MGRRSRTEISPLGELTPPNSDAIRRAPAAHRPEHLIVAAPSAAAESFTRPSADAANLTRRQLRLAEHARAEREALRESPDTAILRPAVPIPAEPNAPLVSRRAARAAERAANTGLLEPALVEPAAVEQALTAQAPAQPAAPTQPAQPPAPAPSAALLAPAMPAPEELSNVLSDVVHPPQPDAATPSTGIPIFVVPPASAIAPPATTQPATAQSATGALAPGGLPVAGAASRGTGRAHSRHGGHTVRSRRRVAATASAASIGLISSLVFAMPADAVPSTLPARALQVAVDSHGRTAAQILAVSSAVKIGPAERDSTVAAALAGIIAGQDGADSGTATTAIAAALQTGGARQSIVETALTYLGDPYVLGGSDHSGIDCSGLVLVAYATVGISLKHLVSSQDAAGVVIPQSEALPGDLVVFDDNEHIGIYLGANLLIAAPEEGRPVNVEAVWAGIPHHFTRILPASN